MTGRAMSVSCANVVDWLLIMNQGEPSDLIRADMLPTEDRGHRTRDGQMGPRRGRSWGLPLRDAPPKCSSGEYLLAQVNRFRGQHLPQLPPSSAMERSALHRKAEILGAFPGPGANRSPRCGVGWPAMPRDAYVNGRFRAAREGRHPYRGSGLSVRGRGL